MRREVLSLEAYQTAVDDGIALLDEHMISSVNSTEASWLGFPLEDPILEGLTQSRRDIQNLRAKAQEVSALAHGVMDGLGEDVWWNLVAHYRTIANARSNTFTALSTLRTCGELHYIPQQRVIDELTHLPDLLRTALAQAASVLRAREELEGKFKEQVALAEEAVQGLRNGVVDQMKSFRDKLEKRDYARSLVAAVDALAPAEVHVSLQSQSLAQENNQLRSELQSRATELTALREHCHEQNARLAQERVDRRRIWDLEQQLKEKEEEINVLRKCFSK